MKNHFRILWLLCAIIALSACQEDKLLTYESEANIFFRQKKWVVNAAAYKVNMTYNGKFMEVKTKERINEVIDSLNVSMAFVNGEFRSDTTFIPVSIIGDIAPVDRPINFEIISVKDPREAVEGVDFRILDAYIPANKRDGGIVVEMMRDPLEVDEYKSIDFRLLPNEHFQTNYKWIERSRTDDEQVSTLTMKLLYTDGLTPPLKWFKSYLGDFSPKKAYVLHYELGWEWDDMYTTENTMVISAYGNALKVWLEQYKKAHDGEPYREADGTEMTSGTSATS